jgi:L-rhamnose mutarotase
MERLLFFIYLYEGKEAEYDKRHDELWPDMAQALTDCGWTNYTLFRNGTTVVGYCEAVPDVATAAKKMGATEVNARWQESFKDIIRHITDREGNLLSYREVWHHD